ncbi:YdaU family protein [Burkholderia cenocepacia]|uniref:YdaU family protein n=1 Tax=Burkholderia cenocepacia TaxID=95486 RepID=UPI0028741ED4|nr:YdaU family protein [Burkholderia cenocepacia]MDS0801737.1 YdaU family protein [Burkholderia cenocepacia]
MNFYKRHIGDYLKDTAHLSLLEHGVYTRLLDVYYTREAGIPEAQAARLIGARAKDECEALRIVLEEFFELVDGTWLQQRCEREIEEASAQAKANRENGRKGGRPKAKKNPPDNPDGTQDETDPKPNGNPLGSVSLTEKNLSQTPDAISQTPDVKPGVPADVGGEPRATVRPSDLSAAMRRHSIETHPGDPRVIAAAEAGITVETIEAACVEAKTSDPTGRIKAGFVLKIAERWTAEASRPRSAARPQQPRQTPEERRRAISKANGDAWLAETPESDPNVIDMEH